jgi:hypothetical protein
VVTGLAKELTSDKTRQTATTMPWLVSSLRKLGVDRAKLVSRLLFVDSMAYPSRRAEVDSVGVVALFLLQLRFPRCQCRSRYPCALSIRVSQLVSSRATSARLAIAVLVLFIGSFLLLLAGHKFQRLDFGKRFPFALYDEPVHRDPNVVEVCRCSR